MKKIVIIVTILFLMGGGYLVYNSLNIEETPVKEETLDKEFISYTLNGSVTDKSYETLVSDYAVNSITCENGSFAEWNDTDKTIKLSSINVPDYCTIDFKEIPKPTLAEAILSDNPTVSTRSSFSGINVANTTGIIYLQNSSVSSQNTEDIDEDGVGENVYYFSGNHEKNWVKFGKYENNSKAIGYLSSLKTSYKEYDTIETCNSASTYNVGCHYLYEKGEDIFWRIVRINEDGSVRLLYSGNDHNTTTAYITESKFNDASTGLTSSAQLGYMYGGNSSLVDNRANTTSSTAKLVIDSWYGKIY